jgi:hypothetical protein
MLNNTLTIGITVARLDIDVTVASKPRAEGRIAARRIELSERAAAAH